MNSKNKGTRETEEKRLVGARNFGAEIRTEAKD